jgi:hypothetical protein
MGRRLVCSELREGKVFKETRYYAEPFEASEERAE